MASDNMSESETEQLSALHKDKAAKHHPEDGSSNVVRKPQVGWKPRSMTAPVLIPIALLALTIAAAIEILAQKSRINGGLALAPTRESIPRYAMLTYLYLPTVVAVLFSLIWNWVDLDVKRMQPWFELSKSEGATAPNSLFLDYPYDFVGIVPFKAAKRRHWPVFLSSTVVVAIFWLVTPLQSSILGTRTISRTEPVALVTRSRLASLEEQNALITPQILSMGYSIGWLGQDYPPFTTASYATLPFYVDNDSGHARPKTNWTATTTKLSTELECWPAEIDSLQPQKSLYSFLNGQGCNMTTSVKYPGRLWMDYSGYYPTHEAGTTALSFSKGCPPTANVTHQFLARWSEQKKDSPKSVPLLNITAIFCQPYYYKQQVSVSVAADKHFTPDDASVVALSPKEKLTEEEFNSTAFEILLANGYVDMNAKLDFLFTQVINQVPKMNETDIVGLVSNMVGFALAGHNEPADAYKDPKKLQEAFNRAHQYLFSSAVSVLLVNETDFPDRTANSTYALTGIVVSRPISAAVEALLLLASVCIIALLWACQNSTSNLQSNPSSISRYVQIFRGSRDLNQLFFSVDHADDKSLAQLFPNDRFRLSRNAGVGSRRLAIERVFQDRSSADMTAPSDLPRGYYKPFRPVALRRVSGILFVLVQVGAIVTVVYLKVQDTRQDGLTRPTNNFEVLQLLENFIPTIFATLTEPVLVLLNRFLCVLQPFQALSKGRSVARQSINITYASIPPQLVIWRAIKRRHFLLVVICVVALLSNVLAVGLSALFKEAPARAGHLQRFHPTIASKFNDTFLLNYPDYLSFTLMARNGFTDHMYLAMTNISLGTSLPPWTTPEYFFLPHVADHATAISDGSQYVVPTRGFGVSVNCTPIAPFVAPNIFDVNKDDAALWSMRSMSAPYVVLVKGTVAMELGLNDQGADNQSFVTFGWGRSSVQKSVALLNTIHASGAMCTPTFQSAMFNVTHDASGHVISHERTSPFNSTLDHAFSKNQTDSLLHYFQDPFNTIQVIAHNDTMSRDWMNYLLTLSMNSRDVLDPTKPLPEPENLIPTIEDIYRRLFALFLSLNQQLFEPADASRVVLGWGYREETRIFMANPACLITVVILGLNVIAAIMFYSTALVSTLPRMPTSIGSMLAYVASSRMVQGDKLRDGAEEEEEEEDEEEKEKTYSFGRYIGVDKRSHLGIDLDPHVALIHPDSIKEKKPLLSALRWRGWENKRVNVRSGTWL